MQREQRGQRASSSASGSRSTLSDSQPEFSRRPDRGHARQRNTVMEEDVTRKRNYHEELASEEMEDILTKLDCSAGVKQKFKVQKVFSNTIKLLSDDQLKELGIEAIGDRAHLREMCTAIGNRSTIREEVKKIFQPYPLKSDTSQLQVSYPALRSYKGKGKARYAHAKYSHVQKKKPRFYKKIVVIGYMGPKAPNSFTIKESLVILHGMLPEIGYEFNEKQVRKCILDTINASEEIPVISDLFSFEFLEANGKRLCVPAQAPELEWTGKALKHLSGSGSLYVRLNCEINDEISEFNDTANSPELEIVKVETPAISQSHEPKHKRKLTFGCIPTTPDQGSTLNVSSPNSPEYCDYEDSFEEIFQTYCPKESQSTSTSNRAEDTAALSTDMNQGNSDTIDMQSRTSEDRGQNSFVRDSNAEDTSQNTMLLNTSKLSFDSNNEAMSCGGSSDLQLEDKAEMLLSMFPTMPLLQLKHLLELAKGDTNAVCDLLLEGLTVQSLFDFWKYPSLAVKRIVLESYNPECAAEELLALYKSNKLSPFTVVRVVIENQPAIDTGGVRRQLYNDALIRIANNEDLFETTDNGVRPVFRQSTLSSGIFTTVGKLIGHSIVMDQQGFPYLSPACFYYLAGNVNTAISETNMGDVGSHIKDVILKLSTLKSLDELDCKDSVIDMMIQSGCDLQLSIRNIPAICEAIILYDVLHKRKVCIDAIAEGLEAFKMKSTISLFPELFKCLFVKQEDAYLPNKIINCFKFGSCGVKEKESAIENLIIKAVERMNNTDLKLFLKSITGTSTFLGNMIYFNFHDNEELPAFSISTCGCQVDVSILIDVEETAFMAAFRSITIERQQNFNMA